MNDTTILKDIKSVLGLIDDDNAYDGEILMHLNSAFMYLNQLGFGELYKPETIEETTTWEEVFSNRDYVNCIKPYIYKRVRLIFDPPGSSIVMQSLENLIREDEYRIQSMLDR